jgi:hypothetical protein
MRTDPGGWMHRENPARSSLNIGLLERKLRISMIEPPRCGQGGVLMKVLRASMLMTALLSGPAFAQSPHINLLVDGPGKTQEEIEKQQAAEKAYKDTLRKIPDAATSNDPWGGVRNRDQPKAKNKPKSRIGVAGGTAN